MILRYSKGQKGLLGSRDLLTTAFLVVKFQEGFNIFRYSEIQRSICKGAGILLPRRSLFPNSKKGGLSLWFSAVPKGQKGLLGSRDTLTTAFLVFKFQKRRTILMIFRCSKINNESRGIKTFLPRRPLNPIPGEGWKSTPPFKFNVLIERSSLPMNGTAVEKAVRFWRYNIQSVVSEKFHALLITG